MNRSVKFKLKNGKVVIIRRVRGTDYDAMMKFFDKFVKGKGAKFTTQYPNQPKKDKEKSMALYDNPNNLFLGAWDGDELIGESTITRVGVDNPYLKGRTGITGTIILDKYLSNGLGSQFKKYIIKWARENGVQRLEAEVYHTNVRSLGNLIKAGYNIIGIKHNVAFIDGQLLHNYILEKIL